MQRLLSFGRALVFAGFTAFAGSVGLASVASAAAPLTVGYSDWPGWIAWQVAIDKGWLAQAGLDVKFEWFDYSASLSALCRGQARRRSGRQCGRSGQRFRRREKHHDHADRLFERQ